MRLNKLDDFRYEIPIGSIPNMNVKGIVYADSEMLSSIQDDGALKQVAQAATLPGAVIASFAMPDIHFGYGFPIGGVLATRLDDGVISPGGVGFDINCGVRLLGTPLKSSEISQSIELLTKRLYSTIPTGVGCGGKLNLSRRELEAVIRFGSEWAVKNGYGFDEDLMRTESGGHLEGASPSDISNHAFERGSDQLGTLGSGNHFIEIQRVDEIFDDESARAFGLFKDQITIMIHTGSRGLGHQVCTDYLKVMNEAVRKYRISLPDRQLACAPTGSPEAMKYLSALRGAANFAWANRQCLTHWIREAFERVIADFDSKDVFLIYDVAHNIVKFENHFVDGKRVELAVHRKGATRALGPGHPDVPVKYRKCGQPVLVPGDMGRYSYVLKGTQEAMNQTFASACHGAGRVLSRKAAVRAAKGRSIFAELKEKGVIVQASSKETVIEEMPDAYKDVSKVVDIIIRAGIADKVARLRPLGVIKG